MWGLLLGVRLARSLALRRVVFEMDSLAIVQMVKNGFSTIPFLQPLLAEVLHLLRLSDWETSVTHVYREANRCADRFANLGHDIAFSCTVLDSAPLLLHYLLFVDIVGVCTPRSVV